MTMKRAQATADGAAAAVPGGSAVTAWVAYEGIQSDILDHLLCVLPEFGLRVFRDPSGSDLRALVGAGETVGGS